MASVAWPWVGSWRLARHGAWVRRPVGVSGRVCGANTPAIGARRRYTVWSHHTSRHPPPPAPPPHACPPAPPARIARRVCRRRGPITLDHAEHTNGATSAHTTCRATRPTRLDCSTSNAGTTGIICSRQLRSGEARFDGSTTNHEGQRQARGGSCQVMRGCAARWREHTPCAVMGKGLECALWCDSETRGTMP